jgi:hypothetical protein
MFQPNIENPYVHSFFLGVQQQITDGWSIDVQGLGAQGRMLVTTDVVNRQDLFHTRINRTLPTNISYRANQGGSSYYALTGVARYRSGPAIFQMSYTWSHSIDNQTEPLALDLFDFGFTGGQLGATRSRAVGSGFLRQFDSRGDRGNSDFDQRQNLTFFSVVELPSARNGPPWTAIFRDWTVSQLAAFRTGFPISAFGVFGRGDLLNPSAAVLETPVPVAGGMKLFNGTAFASATTQPFTLGNSGRNILRGPGLYSIDVSLARSIALPSLGEPARLILRADAYNVLNHANLSTPESSLLNPRFGEARFGHAGRQAGFPSVSPLNETGRQILLGIRIEF